MADEVCVFCGSSRRIQQGHLVAPSKGGRKPVPVCEKCNKSKGNKAFMEWLRDLSKSEVETQKYRWNRIVEYQHGRRGELASKVHTVRDEG